MLNRLLATSAIALVLAMPAYADTTDAPAEELAQASESSAPCNPCNPCNPCAAAAQDATSNPEAEANPCSAANPCNPCNPCAAAATGEDLEEKVIVIQSEDERRMDKLIGMSVTNPIDQDIGDVQDVLYDKDGKLTGVIISVGGFLGIGDKLVAVPWEDVEVNHEEEVVLIDMAEQQLELAPHFKTLEQVEAEKEALRIQTEQRLQEEKALDIQQQ